MYIYIYIYVCIYTHVMLLKIILKTYMKNAYSIVWKNKSGFLTRFLGFGFFLGRFFEDFLEVLGIILGAKMEPKWLQKSIKKLMDFWIGLGSALGRQRRPGQVCPAREGDHGEG